MMKRGDGEQQRLLTMLASIGDGVIATDLQSRVVFLNPVAEALVGWKRDEAMGQPLDTVFRIVNEKTRATVENPVTKALREGYVVGLANHTTLICRDGTERPIDDSAAPIHDDRGRVTGCVLVFRDITKRRRAELALESSERELADLFEHANVGLHWVGPDGAIMHVNQTELDLLGYSRDEYVGRHIAEFHSDEPVIEDIQARLLRGETLNQYPARMRCKDGSIKHVLINSTGRWEDDKFVHSRCFTLDVTDRKRAEEYRALLAAIVAASDDAIVSKTLDGIIQSWNAGAQRLFGYTASEAVGQPITLIIPAELREEEGAILAKLRHGERVDHFETTRVSKDGGRIDVSLTVSPIYDDSGQIIGASKVARDITERKRAEEALLEAEERKDEFLAVLGHELRNPLAPLRTGLELLEHATEKPELIESVRSMMDRQLSHMTRLVDDLLDVSRISSGKLELQRARLDLQGVIEAAIELTRPLIEEHDHELTVRRSGGPLPIEGDFERLTQVLGNLLSNAAKYMEPGGRIAVETELKGDQALVQVRDTGFGIPPERLDYVFEMFSQVAEHRERMGRGGIGIGLALSRRLLALHGGEIEARSAGLGQGSEFVVRLPLAAPAKAARRSMTGSERSGARASRQRVLVVDDNVDAATTLHVALEIEGHVVETVHDGSAAVASMDSFGPDTVLLDIGLPQMDGYEVARRIRARSDGQRVLLIALTGWGQAEDRQRAHEAGFDYHLTKPVTVTQLDSLMAEGDRRRGA